LVPARLRTGVASRSTNRPWKRFAAPPCSRHASVPGEVALSDDPCSDAIDWLAALDRLNEHTVAYAASILDPDAPEPSIIDSDKDPTASLPRDLVSDGKIIVREQRDKLVCAIAHWNALRHRLPPDQQQDVAAVIFQLVLAGQGIYAYAATDICGFGIEFDKAEAAKRRKQLGQARRRKTEIAETVPDLKRLAFDTAVATVVANKEKLTPTRVTQAWPKDQSDPPKKQPMPPPGTLRRWLNTYTKSIR